MNRFTQFQLIGAIVAAVATTAQSQSTPGSSSPATPRAVTFADTLGAAFSIADSATAKGTTADFDFLVGEWEFTFQQRRADGTYSPPFTGHWTADRKRTPNGFIEDHFRGDKPNSTIATGTWTYRVFNPRRHLWEMQAVGSETGAWSPGLSWSDSGNRYVVQHYGSTIIRIRYFSIVENSFQWRADLTDDNGKTWLLDWWIMAPRRIGR